jgi:hypothetical protein
MKSIPSRSLPVLLAILLSISALTIFNVKAQQVSTLKIHIISPSNTTYNQNTILLNFNIQKQPQENFLYTINYTIQGENTQKQGTFYLGTLSSNEMTFHKNFTELPDGTYNLTVFVRYVDRIIWVYADKQTVTFTINTKTPTPSPTPTSTPISESWNTEAILGLSIIIIVLSAGIGLFLYHLKKN